MSDGSTTLRGTPNPEAPNPQLPIVQRLRIRFAKRGRLRFTSHRDFGRAFERAVRRARVPIAFSSGYTPHPKISFAGAAPTGAASEAEFLEIGLTETRDPEAVRAALDDALPPGIDILEVVAARQGAGSLADRLEASEWVIELRDTPVERAQEAADAFLAAEQVDDTDRGRPAPEPVGTTGRRTLRTPHPRGLDARADAAGDPLGPRSSGRRDRDGRRSARPRPRRTLIGC